MDDREKKIMLEATEEQDRAKHIIEVALAEAGVLTTLTPKWSSAILARLASAGFICEDVENAERRDLGAALTHAADKLLSGDFLPMMVSKHLEKLLADLIRDAMSSYGEFGKGLKAKIEESLGCATLNLPSYNHTVLAIVERLVEQYTRDSVQQQVVERMKELLVEPPKEITLEGLVGQFIEQIKDKRDSGCVCYGEDEIGLYVKQDMGFWKVSLNKSKRDYSQRLPSDEHYRPDIFFGATKQGEVYYLQFRDERLEKQLFIGPLYGFERMLFQMKAAKTKITGFDAWQDISTHIPSPGD